MSLTKDHIVKKVIVDLIRSKAEECNMRLYAKEHGKEHRFCEQYGCFSFEELADEVENLQFLEPITVTSA